MVADSWKRSRTRFAPLTLAMTLVVIVGGSMLAASQRRQSRTASPAAQGEAPSHPWTATETVVPADLVKELTGSVKPTVVCVGFPALYRNGRVPGASLHGPASTADGLADLKAWAAPLPRSSNLVVYCGCCPIDHCPNLRPAFSALREMGFTHVRVLELPTSFAADWVGKGYPIEPR